MKFDNMQKQEDKYNATGQLLYFIPKFYFWMSILIVVFAICLGMIYMQRMIVELIVGFILLLIAQLIAELIALLIVRKFFS